MSMRKFMAMLSAARKQKRYSARMLAYLIRGGTIDEDEQDDDVFSRPCDIDPFGGM